MSKLPETKEACDEAIGIWTLERDTARRIADFADSQIRILRAHRGHIEAYAMNESSIASGFQQIQQTILGS